MESIWKTWTEVRQICQQKRVVLFGRSEDWVLKTMAKLPHTPDYVVDSNPGYSGQLFHGLEVRHADTLKTEVKDDLYVIITAGVYETIVAQLEGYGFSPGNHFCTTPEYNDYKLVREMREYQQLGSRTRLRFHRKRQGICRD